MDMDHSNGGEDEGKLDDVAKAYMEISNRKAGGGVDQKDPKVS